MQTHPLIVRELRITPLGRKIKGEGKMLDVGCCVLQRVEKSGAFSEAVSTIWLSRCDRPYISGGYSVQWKREGFKSTMYIYTKDDLLCIGKPNRYGYRYNLNQPVVSGYYQRYLENTSCIDASL